MKYFVCNKIKQTQNYLYHAPLGNMVTMAPPLLSEIMPKHDVDGGESNKKISLGVALVKPTTDYFWFLVTFCHNQICGLAVAFKHFFWGVFPRF